MTWEAIVAATARLRNAVESEPVRDNRCRGGSHRKRTPAQAPPRSGRTAATSSWLSVPRPSPWFSPWPHSPLPWRAPLPPRPDSPWPPLPRRSPHPSVLRPWPRRSPFASSIFACRSPAQPGEQGPTDASSIADTTMVDCFMGRLLRRQEGWIGTRDLLRTVCTKAPFAAPAEASDGIVWITSVTNRSPTATNDEKRSFR